MIRQDPTRNLLYWHPWGSTRYVDNSDVVALIDGRGGVLDMLDEELAKSEIRESGERLTWLLCSTKTPVMNYPP